MDAAEILQIALYILHVGGRAILLLVAYTVCRRGVMVGLWGGAGGAGGGRGIKVLVT